MKQRGLTYRIFILVVFFSTAFSLAAQWQQPVFDRLTVEKGLPNPSVIDVIQDRQGFMWIGTFCGIARYDGYDMQIYYPDILSNDSLPKKKLPKLYEDSRGNIWLGYDRGPAKLYRYDSSQDRFVALFYDPDKAEEKQIVRGSIKGFYEDSRGNLWITTLDYGLYKIDLNELSEDRIPSEEDIVNILPKPLNEKNIIYNSFNHGIVEDQQNNLWIGSEAGLCKFDPKMQSFEYFNLGGVEDANYFDLLLDTNKVIWVGSTKGLFKFDLGEEKLIRHYQHEPKKPESLPGNYIYVLKKINEKQLWIGGTNLLCTFDIDSESFKRIIPSDSKKSNFLIRGQGNYTVNTMTEDFSGNVWIGVWQYGIFIGKKGEGAIRFIRPHLVEALSGGELYFHMEDQQGNLWGLTAESLVKWERDTDQWWETRFADHPLLKDVRDFYSGMVEEEEGNLLFIFDRKLFKYHPERNQIKWIRDLGAVDHLLKASSGNIWVSGMRRPLCKIEDVETKQYQLFLEDYPGIKAFHCIEEDENGIIWLGNNQNGMMKLNPETGEYKLLFSDYGVHQIFFDSHGNCWLVTHSSGLKLYDRERDKLIHMDQELHASIGTPKAIVEDDEGWLWMKTADGIIQFDPLRRKVIRKISALNWLDPSEYWYKWLGFKTRDGTIVYNSRSGILLFNPKDFKANTTPPKVAFTDFKIFHQSLAPGEDQMLSVHIAKLDQVRLDHWQNDLSIAFAALHFKSPLDNQYQYFLKGYDEHWQEVTKNRQVNYTNLAPGIYTFFVKASNSDDVWSEPVHLRIIISSPWWMTWWAFVLYALLGGALIYGLYRFQLNRHLAKAEVNKLKELDSLKTKLYNNITHEFRTPLTIILGVTEQLKAQLSNAKKEQLNMVHRNGRQLLNLVNQMLDLSKIDSGKMQLQEVQSDVISYIQYLIESFHSFAGQKNIRLHFINELDEFVMDFDPLRLQQVLSNLVSNAIKYTPDGGDIYVQIKIEKTHNKEMLVLKVRDTGIGIPAENINRVFDRFYQVDDTSTRRADGTGIGLALSKEIVELMEGQIKVHSAVGKGSTFEIILPVRRNAPLADAKPLEFFEEYDSQELLPLNTLGAFGSKAGKMQQNVLVIEDNHDVVKYLLFCLNEQYRIEVAYNGEQGLEKAIQTIPDLIICDVMMPRKNGYEVCRLLKQDERTSHIPIIMLTAKADYKSKLSGLSIGADAYMQKPFNREELLIRMRNLMDNQKRISAYFQKGMNLNGDSQSTAVDVAPEFKRERIFLEKLQSLIEKHLKEYNFSVEKLAEEMHYSKSQLFRKTKAVTGMSPVKLIRATRIKKAKLLLRDPALSITEVAFDCGFHSLEYFSKVFKKECGANPTEYQNLHSRTI